MRFILCLFALILPLCVFGGEVKDALKEGKKEGKSRHDAVKKSIGSVKQSDLIPIQDKGKNFDPHEAEKKVVTKQNTDSEITNFLLSPDVQKNIKDNKNFDEDEYFITRGDDILNSKKEGHWEEMKEYEILKCQESAELTPIDIERYLDVSLIEQPSEIKATKVCQGHQLQNTSLIFQKNELENFKSEIRNDPNTKSVTFEKPIWTFGSPWIQKYTLFHVNDAPSCDCYQVEHTQIQAHPPKEVDKWVYGDELMLSLMQSPDCTLVQQDCTEANSIKLINGKEVLRPCWREKLSLICKKKNVSDCHKLKGKRCDLIDKVCLKKEKNNCVLWELTYKCYTKIIKAFVGDNAENSCLESDNWQINYAPNNSLAQISSKLAAFEEIEKEMKNEKLSSDDIHVFKAKKMRCSKTIASTFIYDCCFAHSGLATDMGLAKCSADELALAEMRANGLCYYVGKYSEEILNVKTEDKHIYCCFNSKLARVVNEEGRKQLGKDWGSPENPDCKGFTIDELGNLDFASLDLTEVCEDYAHRLPENLQERLESFQNRIKDKIENHPEDLVGEDTKNYQNLQNQKKGI